jgi:hypothetical protein
VPSSKSFDTTVCAAAERALASPARPTATAARIGTIRAGLLCGHRQRELGARVAHESPLITVKSAWHNDESRPLRRRQRAVSLQGYRFLDKREPTRLSRFFGARIEAHGGRSVDFALEMDAARRVR